MKKLLSMFLALFLAVSTFASCAPSAPVSSKPQQSTSAAADSSTGLESDKPITLTMWHSFTQEDRGAAIQSMADEFTKLHPNVTINLEVFPWATFDTKWKTGLSAGELPDISTVLPEGVMMMSQSDCLEPLDDMIAEMGNPFVEKPLEALSFNGKTLAVPFYAHARVLWYRTDVLEKNNIEPPKTLDELLAAAQKITKTGEMYGMAVPMKKTDFYATIYTYIVSKGLGGHMLNKDGKADLTSPEMLQAIQYLVDMYKTASPEGSISYGDPETNDSFIQGKAAFYFESGFAINRVIQGNPAIKDNFAALVPPSKDGTTPGWFADYISLAVWKNAKNPENAAMAKEFVKFMYNEENYVKFLHLVPGGMLPSIKSVADSDAFWNNDVIKAHEADVRVIAEGVANGCPVANDFGPNPATNIIKSQGIIEEMLQNIVLGTMPLEDAAKKAEDTLNAEIAKLG
ncbi:MAG: sugar ABC transporter substrate-binding protein [Ruthenibacterium sp.]